MFTPPTAFEPTGLETVRQAVQQLVHHSNDLATLREWYTLTQQPRTSLLDWMKLLCKLENQNRTELVTRLQTRVPYFQVDPQSLESSDWSTLPEWLRIGNHTALAAKLVFWVCGLGRSVVLTPDFEPVVRVLNEEFQDFSVPVTRLDQLFFSVPDRPAGVYLYRPLVGSGVSTTPRELPESHEEELFRILPDSMTATSRRFYDRLVAFLSSPHCRHTWYIKSDTLHGVVTQDTKEMDRLRTATYNWTRSPNTYESIQDENHEGLLMKQTPNGRWFFRFNPASDV